LPEGIDHHVFGLSGLGTIPCRCRESRGTGIGFPNSSDSDRTMKPNKPAWIAAAVAVAAAGSWLMVREAPAGSSNGRENRPAVAPATGDRKPGTARASIDQDPALPGPAAAVDAAGSLAQAADRSAGRGVAVGGSASAPMVSLPPGASHPSNKRGPDRSGGPVDAAGAAVPPAGLRLAPDVRLPAAALPVDFKMTPVAEMALGNILDDYYRDLAAGLAPELEAATHGQDHGGDGALIETGGNGEKTVVVTNGKVAEHARKRADARFRALFGNAAFNRMTIQSALESRLPAD
jgi:hypothetical protein